MKAANNLDHDIGGNLPEESKQVKSKSHSVTIGYGTITGRTLTGSVTGSGSETTGFVGLNRDVSIAQYETKKETGIEGSFRLDKTTVDFVVNTACYAKNAAEVAFGDGKELLIYEDTKTIAVNAYNDAAGTTILIKNEAIETGQKTVNLYKSVDAGDGLTWGNNKPIYKPIDENNVWYNMDHNME